MSGWATKRQARRYARKWRALHPQRVALLNRASYLKHRAARLLYAHRTLRRAKAYVNRLKSRPCVDCDVRYPPYVMQYDHVRGTKHANVSSLVVRGASRERIDKEIAKCDLVCANCHAQRTHDRLIAGEKEDDE